MTSTAQGDQGPAESDRCEFEMLNDMRRHAVEPHLSGRRVCGLGLRGHHLFRIALLSRSGCAWGVSEQLNSPRTDVPVAGASLRLGIANVTFRSDERALFDEPDEKRRAISPYLTVANSQYLCLSLLCSGKGNMRGVSSEARVLAVATAAV